MSTITEEEAQEQTDLIADLGVCDRVADPHTEAWYAARRTGLGASDIAIAAGVSKWATPLDLYHRKRGEVEHGDSLPMAVGRAVEPVIVTEFVRETGLDVAMAPCPMYRQRERGWMLATPDACLAAPGALLEAKHTQRLSDDWGDDETGGVPRDYWCQVQWQMGVTGFDLVHLALLIGNRDFRTFQIERDEEAIRALQIIGRDFWDRVVEGTPPDGPASPETIAALYPRVENQTVIPLAPDVIEAWHQCEQLRAQARDLEKQVKELRSIVIAAIGENYAGDLGDAYMIRRKEMPAREVRYTTKPYVDCRKVKAR